MYRFVAILLVLSLPQFASAESVSFGAGLDQDGGHIGGSADSVNNAEATGRVHWSGTAITIETGFVLQHFVHLEGRITRTNDPNLQDKWVIIDMLPADGTVIVQIQELNLTYTGSGRVAVR